MLTDAGTTPAGNRLFKFTHQTFLEYFTSVELARRYPSPVKLWKKLRPHIANGEWEIVSHVSLQLLGYNHHGGRDKIFQQLCEDVESAAFSPYERFNLCSFGARLMQGVMPGISTGRAFVAVATRFAIGAQPVLIGIPKPTYDDYIGSVLAWPRPGQDDEDDNDEEVVEDYLSPEEGLTPLLHLLSQGTGLPWMMDEILLEALRLTQAPDAVLAGKAFTFALSVKDLDTVFRRQYLREDLSGSLSSG